MTAARLSDGLLAAPALLPFELASICLKKIRAHPTQGTFRRWGLVTAGKALAVLATDQDQPGIARATALTILSEYLSSASLPAVETVIGDVDPLVRSTVLAAIETLPPAEQVRLAAPGLHDPVRAVRLAAAHALAGVQRQTLSVEQQADFDSALADLIASETLNADLPEAHLNLANLSVCETRPGLLRYLRSLTSGDRPTGTS